MRDAAYKGIVLGAIAALVMLSNPVLAQWGRSAGASLLASSVCLLSGGASCTMTGGLVFSGVATDITTGTNEDLTLSANGTGSVIVTGNGGNTKIETQSSATGKLLGPSIGGVGAQSDRTAAQPAACFYDNGTTSTLCGYGSGAFGIPSGTQHQVTIADSGGAGVATSTTVPVSSHVEVTCNDADGCDYSPGEASVVDGWRVRLCNTSAANVVTIQESAGVVAVQGAATSITLNTMECASCTYTGTSWGCD